MDHPHRRANDPKPEVQGRIICFTGPHPFISIEIDGANIRLSGNVRLQVAFSDDPGYVLPVTTLIDAFGDFIADPYGEKFLEETHPND